MIFTVNLGGTNTNIYLFANAGSADSATAFASNASNETFNKILSNDAVVFTLRRKSLVFDHDDPRAPLPFDGSAVDIGLTAMVVANVTDTRPTE